MKWADENNLTLQLGFAIDVLGVPEK